jgi:hypothetical protein
VQHALQQVLPAGVAVRTKAGLLELETEFQNNVSPVGPIFMLGTAIGFIVGMMITYQILYTDLSDQLAQYATMKATFVEVVRGKELHECAVGGDQGAVRGEIWLERNGADDADIAARELGHGPGRRNSQK